MPYKPIPAEVRLPNPSRLPGPTGVVPPRGPPVQVRCSECGEVFAHMVDRDGRILVDVRSHPRCIAQLLRRGGQA